MREYEQQADLLETAQRRMTQQCAQYKGAQYQACIDAVNQRIAQQVTKKLPGYATGGVVNQPVGQNTMQPKQVNITPQMASVMEPKQQAPQQSLAQMVNAKRQQFANGGMAQQQQQKPMVTQEMINAIAPKGFKKGGHVAAYAEGGDVMADPMMADDMYEPMVDRTATVDAIASVLTTEETKLLDMALNDYPELIAILDKAGEAIGVSDEFTGDGEVSGPGTETSDSIPARLSDGEFVFTAKAVKQIGVENLRDMMAQAEADYDSAMDTQESEQMDNMEEGFALGGLLDQTRQEYADQSTATDTYMQEQVMQQPTNVDGAGRQMPSGDVGIMQPRTVDLQQQQRQRQTERNTNAMSQQNREGLMASGSMGTEIARNKQTARLKKAQEEEQSPQMDMFG